MKFISKSLIALTLLGMLGTGCSSSLNNQPISSLITSYTASSVKTSVTNQGALPDHIYFRTNTETFTETRYIAVRDGKIWVKPNPATGAKGNWQMINSTGLPESAKDKSFVVPNRIVQISAEMDVDHLIAISDKGVIYDWEGLKGDWKDKWGLPSTKLMVMPKNAGWTISRRGPKSTLTDSAGHVHTEGAGVTTLYILDPDGRTINFGDAWLPDFNNHIYGPQRGTFTSKSMAAAGSTLFVMNEYGDMFTRLADFDTEGQDPLFFLTYSYDPTSPEWKRLLPGEDWIKQPKIAGKITGRLTVTQTGNNSSDREIRVEGVSGSQTGYYSKPVYNGAWRFIPTGEQITSPFIDNRTQDTVSLTSGPSRDVNLKGTFKTNSLTYSAQLLNFNVDCSPAILRLALDDTSYDCKLYIRHFYFKGLILATLEVNDQLMLSNGENATDVLNGIGGKKYISLTLEQKGNTLQIHNTFKKVDMEFNRL